MSLFGMGNRKLQSGQPEVDSFIDLCTSVDIDVIELMWSKISHSDAVIVGLDSPKVTFQQSNRVVTDLQYNVKWIKDGVLRFFPDSLGRCWGYLADTERNREWLAKTLHNGWFKIIDVHVRQDVEKLATRIGEQITIEGDHSLDKYVKKEKIVEEKEQLEKEVAELKAQVVALRVANLEPTKPLTGIRIKKDKVENAN